MRKWDVTTDEGRWELEKWLMKKMGWQHHTGPNMNWFWHPMASRREFPGWIWTGDGMVWAKEWAAVEKGIVISSSCSYANGELSGYAEACWEDEFGSDSVSMESIDEPTAVALALARALEEMGVEEGDGDADA